MPSQIDEGDGYKSSPYKFEFRPKFKCRLAISFVFIITAPYCSGSRSRSSLFFERERQVISNFETLKTSLGSDAVAAQYGVLNNRESPTSVDPDATRNLTELITSSGYPVEVYTVKTDDGFLLDLHRIPHGRNRSKKAAHGKGGNDQPKGVVFLQHALLSSACDWVMNFPNDSLGFILADNGYDVWMGNTRGNTYSRRHVSLSPSNIKFWDWSIDEMAQYDMPAFIDFVLRKTGQSSLSLIGHSQGTMMNFAMFSQRPDMEEKVKVFVALAPVAYVGHIASPIAYFSLIKDEEIYSILGKKIFLPNDVLIKFFVDLVCTEVSLKWMCDDVLFLFVGVDFRNLNQSRLEVYFHHSPSGVSVKDIVHFAQLYRQKNFGKYDYGSPKANMAHYNQSSPPEYDVSKVKVPVVAFSANKDWLADPTDVRGLVTALPNLKAWYFQPLWNHMDFVWGLTAAQGCYPRVLDWLHTYNP